MAPRVDGVNDKRFSRVSAAAVERLVVVLIGLAVIAVLGIGLIGATASDDLGRAGERSADLQLAVRELDSTLVARTAIDTDILQAATGQAQDAAEAATQRQTNVKATLIDAEKLLVAAGTDVKLLGAFRTMAASMNTFMDTGVAFARDLAADPSSTPAHLAQLHDASLELDVNLAAVSGSLQVTGEAARGATRTSVTDAKSRMLIATILSLTALLGLAAVITRRIKASFAEKAAAEAATAVATEQLIEQIDRQEFAADLREALENADDEPAALGVVELALEHAGYDGTSELLLADSSRAHLRRVVSTAQNRAATSDRHGNAQPYVEAGRSRSSPIAPCGRARICTAALTTCRLPAFPCCSTAAVSV